MSDLTGDDAEMDQEGCSDNYWKVFPPTEILFKGLSTNEGELAFPPTRALSK